MTPSGTIERVIDQIRHVADRAPRSTVLRGLRGPDLTYSQLAEFIDTRRNDVAQYLSDGNVRVALIVPQSPAGVTSYITISSLCACAPLNPNLPVAEFEKLFKNLGIQLIVWSSDSSQPARQAARNLDIPIVVLHAEDELGAGVFTLDAEPGFRPLQGPSDRSREASLLLTTSGTTSVPKCVALSDANLLASIHGIVRSLELVASDNSLVVMPLFHVHGLVASVLAPMLSGGSVSVPGLFSTVDFLDWIERFKPIWFSAAPSMLTMIAARAATLGEARISNSLRFIRSASAKLEPETAERLEALFNVPVIEAYGMTEASHQVTSTAFGGPYKRGSVGLSFGVDLKIVAPSGKDLGPGREGDVWIKGPNVIQAYDDVTDARLSTGFTKGWFHTGDLGYLDDSGHLFLTGRRKELINRGGESLSPLEIDGILERHPSVSFAVAFAMPDELVGEEVAAAVKLSDKASLTPQQLQSYAQGHLAPAKVPKQILFVNDVPLTATGKVNRSEVAKQFLPLLSDKSHRRPEQDAQIRQNDRIIKDIWESVLQVGRIEFTDSFLELGGDSIAAIRILARLNDVFHSNLSPAQFFANPTISGLSALLKDTEEAPTAPVMETISKRQQQQPAPLSRAQTRLWFLHNFLPSSCRFNRPVVLNIRGDINVDALQNSLQCIVDRHESLRTVIRNASGEPVKQKNRPGNVQVRLLSENLQTPYTTQQWLKEKIEIPFNLTIGPLLRANLLRISASESLALFVFHHIIFDDWSERVFLQELAQNYEKKLNANDIVTNPLPIQYDDYAEWHNRRTGDDCVAKDLAYWKRKLDGAPPQLQVSHEPRDESIANDIGFTVQRNVDGQHLSSLQSLAIRHQSTLFMLLISVYFALLRKLSNANDIVVGVPTTVRSQVATEELIGLFVNPVAIRSCLDGDPTFLELLTDIRSSCLEANDHRELPFEQLVKKLGVERDTNSTPVFQCWFQFRPRRFDDINFGGLECSLIKPMVDNCQFNFALDIIESDTHWDCRFQFREALYSKDSAEEIADQFLRLVQQIADDDMQRLSHYDLLTPHGRKVLPNPSAALDEPAMTPVIEQFRKTVLRCPENIAIRYQQQRITYRALYHHSQKVKSALADIDVEKGSVVAISGPTHPDLVAAYLGTMMQGGVALLLDPSLPLQRRLKMCQEASACVAILPTQDAEQRFSELAGQFEHVLNLEPILHGDDAPLGRTQPSADIQNRVHGNDPAYLFFTSGSTGTPKGVLGLHKSLAHFIAWQRHTFGIGAGDRVAQMAGLSFDVFLRDVFLPLTSGAALCIPTEKDKQYDSATINWINAENITVLHIVPTQSEELIGNGAGQASMDTLRLVFSSGEALRSDLVRRWRDASRAEIVNLYGPTETTLVRMYYRTPKQLIRGVQPLGTSQPNVQALILNSGNRLCSIGEPGEIVLRTPFSTLGYINAPEEQRKRFKSNPYIDSAADCYVTGDLGCYRLDGSMRSLGRIDRQIKVSGIRVEPAEIESVLLRHDAVAKCAVGMAEHSEKRRLAAFIVPANHSFTTVKIRSYLAEQLPVALVPQVIRFVETIPQTASGKTDFAALLSLSKPEERNDHPRRGAETTLEKNLVELWQQVLGCTGFSIDDDFFELGGHSLQLVKLVTLIEIQLQVKVSLPTFFRSPTIALLAKAISAEENERPMSTIVPLQTKGDRPPIFCSPGIGGSLIRNIQLRFGDNQPIYGLESVGLDGVSQPFTTIESMATHNVQLIRDIQPHGPYYLLGSCFGGLVAYETALQLSCSGEAIGFLGLADSGSPPNAPPRYVSLLQQLYRYYSLLRQPRKKKANHNGQYRIAQTTHDADEDDTNIWDKVRKINRQAKRIYRPTASNNQIHYFLAARYPQRPFFDRRLNWRYLTRAGMQVHDVDATHSTILKDDIEKLALSVRQILNQLHHGH